MSWCQMLRYRNVNDKLMTVEHWWNGKKGTPKYTGRNLCWCYFANHKHHLE